MIYAGMQDRTRYTLKGFGAYMASRMGVVVFLNYACTSAEFYHLPPTLIDALLPPTANGFVGCYTDGALVFVHNSLLVRVS